MKVRRFLADVQDLPGTVNGVRVDHCDRSGTYQRRELLFLLDLDGSTVFFLCVYEGHHGAVEEPEELSVLEEVGMETKMQKHSCGYWDT